MNIEEYREYCLSIKGATESFPFGENTLVYKIMDKMFTFAPLNPKDGRFWADTKCDSTKSTELMELYNGIAFGPFSASQHSIYPRLWVSLSPYKDNLMGEKCPRIWGKNYQVGRK